MEQSQGTHAVNRNPKEALYKSAYVYIMHYYGTIDSEYGHVIVSLQIAILKEHMILLATRA